MKKLKQFELQNRIIAKGEHSGHSHIIVGDAEVTRNSKGEILIEITGEASIKHLLEEAWLQGREEWTKEHADIDLTDLPVQIRHGDVFLDRISPNTYKFIQQQVYDPLSKRIEAARD